MSFLRKGPMPLDYDLVRYPGSVLRFRGPGHILEPPYVLCLGGSETFGRFIDPPFASQLNQILHQPVVNMGVMNAGLDVMMHDPAITAAISGASAIVLQIVGAQNMTNRFYTVHPRRNDRFIRANSILRTIFRDVDFTEFHYTRHLLSHLRHLSEDRFEIVVSELQAAWSARMDRFIGQIDIPVHLLWLSKAKPGHGTRNTDMCCDPLFVSQDMLDEIAMRAASITMVSPTCEEGFQDRGMFFDLGEEKAAQNLPGASAHREAAKRLGHVLSSKENDVAQST